MNTDINTIQAALDKHWTPQLQHAAAREGWFLTQASTDADRGPLQVQKIDDPDAWARGRSYRPPDLASDDVACVMVRTGTGPHHLIARQLVAAFNEPEFNRWTTLPGVAEHWATPGLGEVVGVSANIKPAAPVMVVGGRYNWRGQSERLVYIGYNWSGNGRWHQFVLVDNPREVWCEVQPDDLAMFEETKPAPTPVGAGDGDTFIVSEPAVVKWPHLPKNMGGPSFHERKQARIDAASCPDSDNMGIHACGNAGQCFEPCGQLGHDEKHVAPGTPATGAAVMVPLSTLAEWKDQVNTLAVLSLKAERGACGIRLKQAIADVMAGAQPHNEDTRQALGEALSQREAALLSALEAVLPYALSRAEDLVEAKAQGKEDPEYPGADAACAAVESADQLLHQLKAIAPHTDTRQALGEALTTQLSEMCKDGVPDWFDAAHIDELLDVLMPHIEVLPDSTCETEAQGFAWEAIHQFVPELQCRDDANLVLTPAQAEQLLRRMGWKAPGEKREVIEGDVLPPIGSTVYILHGRDDDAHACSVTGYYAWPSRSGSRFDHRVFVTLVYLGTTTEQSRHLSDVFETKEAALAHRQANPR